MPISNRFLTHEGRLYELQTHVELGLRIVEHLIPDTSLVRSIILSYIKPEFKKEASYLRHTKRIVKLYKDHFAWENGMVEYIIRTKKAMDNETANHL